MNYWIIQGIGLLGTLLYFASYQFKSNRKLFRMQFVSYLCYTIHLVLLGAITGGLSTLLNMIRSFCLGSKNKFLKSWYMCSILCILQTVALIVSFAGWISILPIFANIASTIGGYTNNAKKIRWVGMFINSPLWIIYSVIVGSFAGALDEIVSEISMILSVVRYGWKNLDKVEQE